MNCRVSAVKHQVNYNIEDIHEDPQTDWIASNYITLGPMQPKDLEMAHKTTCR